MSSFQWARLTADADFHLRRGAWYRILKLGPVEAVLDVKGKPTAVPRSCLQMVPIPPQRWTIVSGPRDSVRYPKSWGPQYAVCPGCRDRARIAEGHPAGMRCRRCNGLFEIDWNESHIATA